MLTARAGDVEVRELKRSDFEAWRRAYSELLPRQSPFERLPKLGRKLTREVFLETLLRHEESASKFHRFELGVFSLTHKRIVGATDFCRFTRVPTRSSIMGYSIFNRYWGQGLGSCAVRATLQIGFKQLGLEEIFLEIEPGNERSLAIAKKFGFVKSGDSVNRSLSPKSRSIQALSHTKTGVKKVISFCLTRPLV